MDKLGRNELFYKICDKEELDAIKIIRKEEDVNFQDINGYSYLHAAVDNRMVNIIKELINRKANIDIKDKYGRTPLMLAISSYNGDKTIINLLIENGADVNARTVSGVSCKQIAKMKEIEI